MKTMVKKVDFSDLLNEVAKCRPYIWDGKKYRTKTGERYTFTSVLEGINNLPRLKEKLTAANTTIIGGICCSGDYVKESTETLFRPGGGFTRTGDFISFGVFYPKYPERNEENRIYIVVQLHGVLGLKKFDPKSFNSLRKKALSELKAYIDVIERNYKDKAVEQWNRKANCSSNEE